MGTLSMHCGYIVGWIFGCRKGVRMDFDVDTECSLRALFIYVKALINIDFTNRKR